MVSRLWARISRSIRRLANWNSRVARASTVPHAFARGTSFVSCRCQALPDRSIMARIPSSLARVTRHDEEELTRLEMFLVSASFIAVLTLVCVGIQRWAWLDEGHSWLIALQGPVEVVTRVTVDHT